MSILEALFLRFVDHVQRHDCSGAAFEHLVDEVQVASKGRCVSDDEDDIGPRAAPSEHGVDGDLLVARSRAQAVAAREVDELGTANSRKLEHGHRAGDGDARIVADLDVGARQGVEERGLA